MKKDEYGIMDLYGAGKNEEPGALGDLPAELLPPEGKKEQIKSALKAFGWFLVIFIVIIFAYKFAVTFLLRSAAKQADAAASSAVSQTAVVQAGSDLCAMERSGER